VVPELVLAGVLLEEPIQASRALVSAETKAEI